MIALDQENSLTSAVDRLEVYLKIKKTQTKPKPTFVPNQPSSQTKLGRHERHEKTTPPGAYYLA